MVRAYVGHLRTTTADGSPPRSRKERAKAISPRALRWLLARKRDDLEEVEQARLGQLLNLSPEVQTIYALTLSLSLDGARAQAPGVVFLDATSDQERYS